MPTISLWSSCNKEEIRELYELDTIISNHELSGDYNILERGLDYESLKVPTYYDKYITIVEDVISTTLVGQPIVVPTVYSSTVSGNFTRNNCGDGFITSPIVYSVTEVSFISLFDAQSKASVRLAAEGQSYANEIGVCNCAIAIQSTPVTYNGSRGTITINAQYATEFSIDGVVYQNSNVFSDLPVGTYRVYARKGNNCTITTTVQITEQAQNYDIVNISYGATNCILDYTGEGTIVNITLGASTCN